MSGDSNQYNLRRESFGQKINFKAKEETDLKFLCFKPDPSAAKNYEQKNPKTITLSNIPDKSSHIIRTEKTKTRHISVKHTEGGWPESVKDPTEPREVNAWKRTKEKQEDFPTKVKILIANTTAILKQNLRMDIYEEYFEEGKDIILEDNFSAKIKTVFKDTEPYKRSVNKVVWSVDENQSKIAVAYRLNKGEIIPTTYKLPCLVWDISNPNTPCNMITFNSEILTVAFNSKHNHIIGVGCANGTAAIFDLNTNKLIASTRLEESHSEAISDFIWLKSKMGTEFVTSSTDGKVIWWDIKNMFSTSPPPNIEPDKPYILVDKEDGDKEYGGMKIEYNPEAGANKFLIGTEQGTIFLANKKKNEAEPQNKLGFKWGRHLGPVLGMQRCPAQTKYMLTVGDWTARIWPDDGKIPVMITKYHPAYLTDCQWNAPRVGLFFVSRSDGWINAYDLCYKINDPAFAYKVSDTGLTSIAVNLKGDRLLVGDEEGKVSLVKLSKSFYSQDNTEYKKDFINKLFDRESAREKMVENIVKKKLNPGKDDQTKQLKMEQMVKERIRRIEEEYLPFVNGIFHRGDYVQPKEDSKNNFVPKEDSSRNRENERVEKSEEESVKKDKSLNMSQQDANKSVNMSQDRGNVNASVDNVENNQNQSINAGRNDVNVSAELNKSKLVEKENPNNVSVKADNNVSVVKEENVNESRVVDNNVSILKEESKIEEKQEEKSEVKEESKIEEEKPEENVEDRQDEKVDDKQEEKENNRYDEVEENNNKSVLDGNNKSALKEENHVGVNESNLEGELEEKNKSELKEDGEFKEEENEEEP
jgi:dynein intermediate chain 2